MSLRIRPITFKEAKAYVDAHHRHHAGSQGCKFCISVYEGDRLCGVAMSGRPVARRLDDGYTLEINRVCTDGTRNACSKLYGSCVRIAKEMGYRRVITYILQSEDGASVRASGFANEGIAGGIKWTGERDRGQKIPHELKTRYVRYIGSNPEMEENHET